MKPIDGGCRSVTHVAAYRLPVGGSALERRVSVLGKLNFHNS